MDADEASKEIKKHHKCDPKGFRYSLFGREAIDEIMSHNDCHGIICEMAEGDDGHKKIIISAVDSSGLKIEGTDVNFSTTCPPYCNDSD